MNLPCTKVKESLGKRGKNWKNWNKQILKGSFTTFTPSNELFRKLKGWEFNDETYLFNSRTADMAIGKEYVADVVRKFYRNLKTKT